jgi:ABC-type oligopeptide transport system substrate-binding subunit
MLSPEVPDDLFASFRPVQAAGIFRAGLVDAEGVGLHAPAPDTLEITLGEAGAQLRHVAALWLGAPAPGEGASDQESNGPYVLDSWAGERITLRPNAGYWAGPPPAPLVVLSRQRAVEDALTDLSGGAASPRAGPADGRAAAAVLADVVPVPEGLVGSVLADPRLDGRRLRQPRAAMLWLTLNVTRPPLNDATVRKALAYAIDRQRYVEAVLDGAGEPAYSLLPAGTPGHDPAAGAGFGVRPEVVRALLESAGYGSDAAQPLTITIPATGAGRRAATFLRDELERNAGLPLGVVELDRYSYVRALERRQFDLAFSGWESPYPDPEGWFWLPFGAGKAENRTGWENRTFDALWGRADAVIDPEARLALFQAAQQILLDEMPVVFLAQPVRLAAVHPRVAGLTVSFMDEYPGVAGYARARLTG